MNDKVNESLAVVVRVTAKRADEYVVKERDVSENRYSEQTVHDFNQGGDYSCEPGEPVVEAVYLSSITEDVLMLTRKQRRKYLKHLLDKIDEDELNTYAFPITRLVETETEKLSTTEQ